MIKIEDYILLSRDIRRSHLDLSSSCDERGGGSKDFRGLLAHHLDTSIPTGYKINLCHACNNEKCSNVNHLYWGTSKDNHQDRVENGTYKTVHTYTVSKYGIDGTKSIYSRAGKAGSKSNIKTPEHWEQFRHFFENENLSKRGWPGRISKLMHVTPTHVRRIAKKLALI